MSEQTDGASAAVNGAANAVGRVDGIRVPKSATHWRCLRYTHDGDSRLSFGVVPETGEHLTEAPVETFSIQTIRTLFGGGDFRAQWVARDEDGGSPRTLARSELIRLDVPASEKPASKGAAAAMRFCEACGGVLTASARFCASCGVSTTGAAPAPAPLNSGDPLAFALAFQNAFTAGQASALAIVQQVTQQVATHEEARTARYQADVQERIERERQAHERAMNEQQAFYARTATPAIDPEALMKGVRTEIKSVTAKVDELAAQLEEDDEEEVEEPIGEPSETASTLAANVGAFTAAAEKAGPMLGSALKGAVEMYTTLRANGAASAGS
jgi:hypothetical protein